MAFRRCRFGDRRFGDGPFRRRAVSATCRFGDVPFRRRAVSATGRFGDGTFRRRDVSAGFYFCILHSAFWSISIQTTAEGCLQFDIFNVIKVKSGKQESLPMLGGGVWNILAFDHMVVRNIKPFPGKLRGTKHFQLHQRCMKHIYPYFTRAPENTKLFQTSV